MNPINELTSTQRAVFIFMARFFEQNDQLPTRQAIADHFLWSSPNAAQEVLVAMERKGVIERNALGKYRFARIGGKRLSDIDATLKPNRCGVAA